jgi:hypothetical protein
MDRTKKIDLIKRTLGLRHKLKVHESMDWPDAHDELAGVILTKWDLEDELTAIEELLAEGRKETVQAKKTEVEKFGVKPDKYAKDFKADPE